MANSDARIGYVGLAVAGVGLAHFASPGLFDRITARAFPQNTRQYTFINGALETILGFGVAAKQTRRLAAVGTIGYVGYLAANVIRNR